jgi:hypothetical protein
MELGTLSNAEVKGENCREFNYGIFPKNINFLTQAKGSKSGPGWIRTSDQAIMSRLL